MAERLQAWLSAFLPDLAWRPIWMGALSTWLLVIYWYQGSPKAAPQWFLEAESRLTGIGIEMFHRQAWSHACAVVLLLLVPLAVARFGAGLKPSDLGLRIRGAGREVLLVLALWLIFVPVIWYFSTTPSFAAYYPRLKAARADASLFVLYQAYYLVKWTAWEFFFRGFMLFGFRRDLGASAILISTIPFAVMHVGKPEAEVLSAFVGGMILCAIALKSRSIWPGVIIHSLVATTMDFFASTWWR